MKNKIKNAEFCELCNEELQYTEGGYIVTGAMIIKGIGVLASGIAFGEVIGSIIENI